MNYYLWVDSFPTYWWVAKGEDWNSISGLWFFDRGEWLSAYPRHPDKNPGALMTSDQVVKITKDEAYKIMLSPTKEVIKPIMDKYGTYPDKFDWESESV